MYYPIIDKLKTLMTDIAAVKEKDPLIIVGTMTRTTGGTWTGNYSDIAEAFSMNRQVLFTVVIQGNDTPLIPLVAYNPGFSTSACFPYSAGRMVIAYGTIESDNSFTLHTMF